MSFEQAKLYNPIVAAEKPGDSTRSPEWPRARDAWLRDHPTCAVCGDSANLNVHHIHPFHLHPELELCQTNFITLGESPTHLCHLLFGHLYNFHSYNVDVVKDAAKWLAKIKNRPDEHLPGMHLQPQAAKRKNPRLKKV